MQETENRGKAGGCLRLIFRIVLGAVLILVVLGIIGTLYERQAKQTFLDNNPPPGQLIDIGGRSLHMNCVGTGSPTVILEAGQGGWSIDYVDIQSELATRTRVCAYDRAGYGWSDGADDNRLLEDLSNDLNQLIANSDIETPVVLVGFSFSGLHTRHYYEQYPDDVAGLVLIDPAHEDDRDIQSDELLSAQRALIGTYGAFEAFANMGVVRLLNPQEIAPYAPFIAVDPASPDLYYGALAGSDWWGTSRKEFTTNLQGDLPELPVDFAIPVRIIGLTNSIADDAYATLNQDRLDLLQSLVAQSESAELIVLDEITHEEIIQETEFITDVISDVLDTIATN